MSKRCAAAMPLDATVGLGRLRGLSGIEVCELDGILWLHVRNITDDLDSAIRKLPCTRFAVLADGQLVRSGTRVPRGQLPDGPWTELADWMTLEMPPEASCGTVASQVEVRLVRGGSEREANVIVTNTSTWQEYASQAPRVRLDRLAFAINGDGGVVVRGTPLPPVTGKRFVERSGVAVEAGWTWTPSVDPNVLAALLRLDSDDLALLHVDQPWDHIHGDDFVRATRSAVRLSVEAFSND